MGLFDCCCKFVLLDTLGLVMILFCCVFDLLFWDFCVSGFTVPGVAGLILMLCFGGLYCC